MSETEQVDNHTASNPPSTAPWWNQADDQRAGETSSETAASQAEEPEGSFWDRVEDATRAQKERDPFESWDSGFRAPASTESYTQPEEGNGDVASGESADSSADRDPQYEPTLVTGDHDGDQVGIASQSPGNDAPATAAQGDIRSVSMGGGVMAELDAIARDLARARAESMSDVSEKLTELRSAIETARERPREIDAMLALSGELDTITNLVAANDRMGAAIDAAVSALSGGRGES